MKLTYIYHSCFVLESGEFDIVFDYYKDSGKSPLEGYIHDEILTNDKQLYVLASHFHPDHFNPDVLKWKQEKRNIIYIFSSDILEHKKAHIDDALYVNKGEVYQDNNLFIQAFGSTDSGVSFLVEIQKKMIFHAGDLNNWHWIDESSKQEAEEAERAYMEELRIISESTKHVDLVMFPLDPRLGSQYMLGAEQFIANIQTDIFVPMHFSESYDKVAAFKSIAGKYHCRLLELKQKGQQFEL